MLNQSSNLNYCGWDGRVIMFPQNSGNGESTFNHELIHLNKIVLPKRPPFQCDEWDRYICLNGYDNIRASRLMMGARRFTCVTPLNYANELFANKMFFDGFSRSDVEILLEVPHATVAEYCKRYEKYYSRKVKR